ncbi:MAG: hypothetical protein ACYTG0_16950 [Planctomycetota bacterium]|jgi:hypothetical protein
MKTEQDFRAAVDSAPDPHSLQSALGGLALFLSMSERYSEAQPFWDQATELLCKTTSPDHRELGTFIFNKVEYHCLPAGLLDQAQVDLERARAIWSQHFRPDSPEMNMVNERLNELRD